MWDFLSANWLWILLIGGMLWMHLGHGGHGGHGRRHEGRAEAEPPAGAADRPATDPAHEHDNGVR